MKYPPKKVQALLKAIYEGRITTGKLPKDLYFAIANELKKGLYLGFKKTLKQADFGKSDARVLKEMRENIYYFSGAKVYHEVRELTDAIHDDEGDRRSFKDFKPIAEDIAGKYNEEWLRAEYETAISQAINAVSWNQIEEQADVLPLLQYSAVSDEVVCDICEPFDGLVAPVDDPIWDMIFPANHFRCRCTVEQLGAGDAKRTPKDEVADIHEAAHDRMPLDFQFNPGKEHVVFDDNHPYFDVAPKDKKSAEENFGLPIPNKDGDDDE